MTAQLFQLIVIVNNQKIKIEKTDKNFDLLDESCFHFLEKFVKVLINDSLSNITSMIKGLLWR